MMTRNPAARAAVLAVLFAGCAEAPLQEMGSDTRIDGEPASEPALVDWTTRTVTLEEPGWGVEFCEGEGPFLCIERDGRPAGSLELARYPLDSYPLIAAARQSAGDSAAVAASAAQFGEVVEVDRREIGIEMHHDPAAPVQVAGGRGLRSGFRGMQGERMVERVVQYRTITGDTLFLLNASAIGGDGPSPMGEFRFADLEAFLPVLDRIIARSRFTPAHGAAPAIR